MSFETVEGQLIDYAFIFVLVVGFMWYHVPLINSKIWEPIRSRRKELETLDIEPKSITAQDGFIFIRGNEKDEVERIWTVEDHAPPVVTASTGENASGAKDAPKESAGQFLKKPMPPPKVTSRAPRRRPGPFG